MSVVPFDPNRRRRSAAPAQPGLRPDHGGDRRPQSGSAWAGPGGRAGSDPVEAAPPADRPGATLGATMAPTLGATMASPLGAPPAAAAQRPRGGDIAPRPRAGQRSDAGREPASDDQRLEDALARVAALERALIATLRENAQNWARAERAESRLAMLDHTPLPARPLAAPEG